MWEKEKLDGRMRKTRGQETRYGECRLKKGEGRHEIREGGCKLKEGEERQET
jgi:hypothetical protein